MIMLKKLGKGIGTIKKKIIYYRIQNTLTKEVAKREARINGLKAYIRCTERSTARDRAIENIKKLEIEISERLADISALRYNLPQRKP